ncbi:hypothetical protein [Wenxinia marina]|uniref:hypothetical protein n=1 Tax=Wenxinia marina TaxID=390641 RepID=UPI000360AEA9|nr:hypothetical protein [Wenxinia marina]
MSRLVLHIGTHKTATTSIQRFLRRNAETLAGRGVWYPGYDLVGAPNHYAHLEIANALSGRSASDPDQARAFLAAVRAGMADHDVTILSAESFYRHVVLPRNGKMPEGVEAYWDARRCYIAQVHDLIGPAEITVVFRRQDDYAQSLYQEHVKVTRIRRGFKTFLKDYWYHFAFLDQVRAWEEVFGPVRVLGFERLRETGDVIGSFCAALGIAADDLPRPAVQNESLPLDLVVMKRLLHGFVPDPEDEDEDPLRRHVLEIARRFGPEDRAALLRRSLFESAARQAEFLDGFMADNRVLGGLAANCPPDAPLFPPDDGPGGILYGDKLQPPFLDALGRLAAAAPLPEEPR